MPWQKRSVHFGPNLPVFVVQRAVIGCTLLEDELDLLARAQKARKSQGLMAYPQSTGSAEKGSSAGIARGSKCLRFRVRIV